MEISNNSKRKIAFERKKKYLIKLSGLLHVPTINWEEQKKITELSSTTAYLKLFLREKNCIFKQKLFVIFNLHLYHTSFKENV